MGELLNMGDGPDFSGQATQKPEPERPLRVSPPLSAAASHRFREFIRTAAEKYPDELLGKLAWEIITQRRTGHEAFATSALKLFAAVDEAEQPVKISSDEAFTVGVHLFRVINERLRTLMTSDFQGQRKLVEQIATDQSVLLDHIFNVTYNREDENV